LLLQTRLTRELLVFVHCERPCFAPLPRFAQVCVAKTDDSAVCGAHLAPKGGCSLRSHLCLCYANLGRRGVCVAHLGRGGQRLARLVCKKGAQHRSFFASQTRKTLPSPRFAQARSADVAKTESQASQASQASQVPEGGQRPRRGFAQVCARRLAKHGPKGGTSKERANVGLRSKGLRGPLLTPLGQRGVRLCLCYVCATRLGKPGRRERGTSKRGAKQEVKRQRCELLRNLCLCSFFAQGGQQTPRTPLWPRFA
jgi:hypothetical protein